MEKIFFATKNVGKVDYVQIVLGRNGIRVVHYPLKLPEIQSPCVEEVAAQKVKYAFHEINNGREKKVPCIAIDSGLFLNAYNGEWPGTLVKSTLEKGPGVEGILKLLEGETRECDIRPCVAYWDGMLTEPICFTAKIKGRIADKQRGERKNYHWSDLCRVFIPDGLEKTEAEMSKEEYDGWRREVDISVPEFAKWIREIKEE